MIEFDLISPDRRVSAGEARFVQIPGFEGDFTAMAGHAPLVSELRPGIVAIATAEGTDEYFVTGGFSEVTGQKISVLADSAMQAHEVDAKQLEALLEAETAGLEGAKGAERDRREKTLSELKALLAKVGGA